MAALTRRSAGGRPRDRRPDRTGLRRHRSRSPRRTPPAGRSSRSASTMTSPSAPGARPRARIGSIRIAACSRTAHASSRRGWPTDRTRGVARMTRRPARRSRPSATANGWRAPPRRRGGRPRRDPRRRRGRHALPDRLPGDAARAADDARHPGRREPVARRAAARGDAGPVVSAGRGRVPAGRDLGGDGRPARARGRHGPRRDRARARADRLCVARGRSASPSRTICPPGTCSVSRNASRTRRSSSRHPCSAGCGSSRTPTRSRS